MNNEVIDSRTAQRTKLERLDLWANQFSDRLNPILIKETRQSLKSRQFIFTFFSLLTAALGWTIVGSLSRMPQIYTTPSAPTLLLGYYAVLAVPMLLVVPLAAYRSLEVEIDDGTLELLSISSLSPWQVVLGKLASSLLQIFLYFIVLLPCMAYAYTLRSQPYFHSLDYHDATCLGNLPDHLFGVLCVTHPHSKRKNAHAARHRDHPTRVCGRNFTGDVIPDS